MFGTGTPSISGPDGASGGKAANMSRSGLETSCRTALYTVGLLLPACAALAANENRIAAPIDIGAMRRKAMFETPQSVGAAVVLSVAGAAVASARNRISRIHPSAPSRRRLAGRGDADDLREIGGLAPAGADRTARPRSRCAPFPETPCPTSL